MNIFRHLEIVPDILCACHVTTPTAGSTFIIGPYGSPSDFRQEPVFPLVCNVGCTQII